MSPRMFRIAAAALAFACARAEASDQNRIVIQAIIDNGGTVTEEGAQGVINDVIAGFANLRGRGLTRSRIDIILTSHPTTVWSGDVRQLIAQGRDVLAKVTINDRCSDVGRALRQADQNLRVAGADAAYLDIFSPLIFAPFPCDKGPGITLPQPVPKDVALGRMVEERRLKALHFFGVHPSQEPVWTDYLNAQGILAKAQSGEIAFRFLGFEQSKTFLSRQQLGLREARR